MEQSFTADNRERLTADDSSSVVSHPSSIIVVGLGNPILGDDGVGWRVVETLGGRLGVPLGEEHSALNVERLTLDCFSLGGLSLMERLIGYDRAIIVDALEVNQPPGSVMKFPLEDLPDLSGQHTTSIHDTSLQTALKVGREMGARLPGRVMVIGIAARQVYDFSEELSPEIAAAVPDAVQSILDLITSGG
jgi:hydrogenase maturation protease